MLKQRITCPEPACPEPACPEPACPEPVDGVNSEGLIMANEAQNLSRFSPNVVVGDPDGPCLSHRDRLSSPAYQSIMTNMQNKPNFLNAQINVSSFVTKDYENVHLLGRRKNKANSNPIKPNFKPNQTQFQTQTNPIGRVGFSPPILFSNFFLFFTFLCPIYNLAMQNRLTNAKPHIKECNETNQNCYPSK